MASIFQRGKKGTWWIKGHDKDQLVGDVVLEGCWVGNTALSPAQIQSNESVRNVAVWY